MLCSICVLFFFFNDTATTEIYTLSLHDALPIFDGAGERSDRGETEPVALRFARQRHQTWRRLEAKDSAACGGNPDRDRKSTRLNSSHLVISYAVFCFKKKKNQLVNRS